MRAVVLYVEKIRKRPMKRKKNAKVRGISARAHKNPPPAAIDPEKLCWMYRKMLLIRSFEEAAMETFRQRLWKGSLHGCIGQEAPAAVMCAAMEPGDYFVSNHRGHGHYLAKGLDPKRFMAELFGKSTGYCKGRGGSMHTMDKDARIYGHGLVGSGAHLAAGIGLAIKMKGKLEVVACSFGDGAVNTGGWHEGVNFAAVHKLPVIYICENNQMAVYTPISETTPVKDISVRAAGYNIPGVTVDGADVITLYGALSEAVERARRGEGPSLVEVKCYRWRGHTVWDPATYRSEEENEEWSKHDAIPRLEKYLLSNGFLTEDDIAGVKAEVRGEIDEAVEFAKSSPEPELTRAEAVKYIYVD